MSALMSGSQKTTEQIITIGERVVNFAIKHKSQPAIKDEKQLFPD